MVWDILRPERVLGSGRAPRPRPLRVSERVRDHRTRSCHGGPAAQPPHLGLRVQVGGVRGHHRLHRPRLHGDHADRDAPQPARRSAGEPAAGPTRPQLIPLGVPGAGSNARGGGQRAAPGVVPGRLFYWKAKHRPKDVRASQLAGRKGPVGGLIGTQPSGESGARPVQGLKQLCLLELSMTTATFSVCASNTVATSHVWLRGLGMWRVQPGS